MTEDNELTEHYEMTEPNEFLLHQKKSVAEKELAIPDICPQCSKPASKPANVLRYLADFGHGFEFSVDYFFNYVLGSSKVLLKVKLCPACTSTRRTYKILEWVSRVLGVALFWILMVGFTKVNEKPIIFQGAGVMLLVLTPFIIGAVLRAMFRNRSDRIKGVTVVAFDGRKNWLRAESEEWLTAFLAANATSDKTVEVAEDTEGAF